jgi:predicted nucleic acid-binding protein
VSYLLDTNILSELRKKEPNKNVAAWFLDVAVEELYLSPLIVGEIYQGIARLRHRNDEAQASQLEEWLNQLLRVYETRILPLNLDIMETWGTLNVPDPLPAVDGLLAATALVHDFTLLTRNTRDVKRTGAKLLNPFAEDEVA